ncbi:MAG TPA: class I SAM-dependent methyltransferase [Terriglobia bacterium]|jgi:predicted O-methyltransferase YrrM
MDKAVERILRAFETRSNKEWERMRGMDTSEMQQHLDEFLLSVGPATGQLLNLLAKEAKAKTLLEVGSSYGYSTVWLADAARQTGGKLISLELHAGKQENARAAIKKAGLDGFVDFRLGDARDLLAKLKGKVDFVLLDLWKDLYIPCFDLFYPKLSAGALVVADNMTFPESARRHAEAYRKHIRKKSGIQSVLLPVGSGLELSRYK